MILHQLSLVLLLMHQMVVITNALTVKTDTLEVLNSPSVVDVIKGWMDSQAEEDLCFGLVLQPLTVGSGDNSFDFQNKQID